MTIVFDLGAICLVFAALGCLALVFLLGWITGWDDGWRQAWGKAGEVDRGQERKP